MGECSVEVEVRVTVVDAEGAHRCVVVDVVYGAHAHPAQLHLPLLLLLFLLSVSSAHPVMVQRN